MFCITLLYAVLLAVYSQRIPGWHTAVQLADHTFVSLDVNPQDGVVTEAEWDELYSAIDTNQDDCLSKDEYLAQSSTITHATMERVYHHFDKNHDGCIGVSDMQAEYHVIDQQNDGQVNHNDFLQYFIGIVHTERP